MKDFRSVLLSAAPMACLLALSACGGGGDKHSADNGAHGADKPAAEWVTDPTSYCPQVAVLQQAQTVTLFLPGKSGDIASQLSTAQISGVSGACTYEKKNKQHVLQVQFTSNFLANNGPANQSKPITLPWFVAITKGSEIIDKKQYSITLNFNGNMSTAAATSKPVKVEFPPTPDSGNLEILVGFELTPDQLAYAAAHPNAAP